jgi:transcriptional regulator with XRE-family HTH domain
LVGASKATQKGGIAVTNRELLEEKINQKGLKKGFLAEKIGVSRATFSALLRNESEFKVSQIRTLCELLGIDDDETMKAIFFAPDGA